MISELYVAAMLLVYAGVLYGYFKTKRPGFGPFNTSIIVIILVLMTTSIGFMADKISADDTTKILFALIGFAAGLFVKRDDKSDSIKNN